MITSQFWELIFNLFHCFREGDRAGQYLKKNYNKQNKTQYNIV